MTPKERIIDAHREQEVLALQVMPLNPDDPNDLMRYVMDLKRIKELRTQTHEQDQRV